MFRKKIMSDKEIRIVFIYIANYLKKLILKYQCLMNLPQSNKVNNRIKNVQKTLDIRHNNYINDLSKKDNKISQLKKKIRDLDLFIHKFENNKNDSLFDKYIEFKDEKRNIIREISNLEDDENSIDYYTNTANLLFNYYNIVENGSKYTDVNNVNVNESPILKYFVKDIVEDRDDNTVYKQDDKATLLDKYLEYTDKNYVHQKTIEQDNCQYCNSSNLNVMINDGMVYCNDCSSIEYIIVDHDRPSYKDPPILWAEKSKFRGYQDTPLSKFLCFLSRYGIWLVIFTV